MLVVYQTQTETIPIFTCFATSSVSPGGWLEQRSAAFTNTQQLAEVDGTAGAAACK